ncbi:MAG: ATP-dependent helicase [Nannocystaceae bacterium]
MRSAPRWTPEQEAILAHPLDAHALIRAVPGSGKTTTLVGRVAHDLGIMDVRVNTFDSLGLAVIHAAQHRGLLSRPLEVVAEGTTPWARAVHKRYREKIQDDEELADAIAYWKAHLVPPSRAAFSANEHLVAAYKDFEELRLQGGVLRIAYADMVYTAVGILNNHPRLLGQVSHFLVDEFQDVNLARVTLIQRLSSETTSIIAVGDEDQGINEWCGAHPRYLRDFASFFRWRNVREYPLSSSFRFGSTIAAAATRLIRNNASRDELEIVGAGPNDGLVVNVDDIPASINALVAEGIPRNEIAVLYRARTQGVRVLAEIAAARIPMETKDFDRLRKCRATEYVLRYLRLATSDEPAVMDEAWRIVYAPERYVQKEAFARQLAARREGLAAVLGDRSLAKGLGQPPTAIDAMAELAVTLTHIGRAPTIREALDVLLTRVDLESQLNATASSERQQESNRANLDAICHLLRQLDVAPFLAEAALMAVDPTCGAAPEERIWMSTIHKAKGREWRCVLLPALAEGLCPAQRLGDAIPGTLQDPDGIEQSPWIEQERRIFYVGVTRASERLFLQASESAPSRFLAELRPPPPSVGPRRRRKRSRRTPPAAGPPATPRPAAHGEPWDEAADKALIDAWTTDADLTSIAGERGRSVGAILHRVVRLGLVNDLEEARAAKS